MSYRIGLCGFENPMRDPKTEEAKKHINQGVKIKMDEQGNILIKRLCKNNVYIKPTSQEDNAIGAEIARNSQGALEHEKPGKVSVPPFNLLHSNFSSIIYSHFTCMNNTHSKYYELLRPSFYRQSFMFLTFSSSSINRCST